MAKSEIFKKALVLLVIAALALSLAGCSEIKLESSLTDDVLVEINDQTLGSAEGIFRLMELIDSYGDIDENFFERSVDDMTMDEYLKLSVKEEMIKLLCIVFIADDLAIYLTDDELEEVYEEADAAYVNIAAEYAVSAYGITQEDARALYEKQALYEKVYTELTTSVTMSISETDTKVIEVNFVLLPEGTTIDEADEFRDVLLSAADFATACSSAGYEPYTNITLKKGDMITAFENVAFALSDGEISECTETVDGIYIIECIEDYLELESAANYNAVITAAKDEIFEGTYSSFYESVEIRFNSSFWEDISAAGL